MEPEDWQDFEAPAEEEREDELDADTREDLLEAARDGDEEAQAELAGHGLWPETHPGAGSDDEAFAEEEDEYAGVYADVEGAWRSLSEADLKPLDAKYTAEAWKYLR
jgi:hypothetical protein